MRPWDVSVALPTLGVSANLRFDSEANAALVRDNVIGRISGARLPAAEWRPQPPDSTPPQVRVQVEDRGSDVRISYTGVLDIAPYVVDKAGLHWDFYSVITALIVPRLMDRDVVAFHAAALRTATGTVLLPGTSGAGKSSVAFAALAAGVDVVASELAFVRHGGLIAGNSLLTIDAGALSRFHLAIPAEARETAGRIALPGRRVEKPLPVSRVVFPRVSPGGLHIRRISARRARMLLFENAIGEMPASQLVAHETVPIGVELSRHMQQVIAAQVVQLAGDNSVILEGSPADIVRYIVSAHPGEDSEVRRP